MELFIIILHATIIALTPLLLAGLGELVVERSGVLNLGVEGMMIMGAVSGFVTTIQTTNLLFGFVMAIASGVFMALLFGFLSVVLRTNQVATGLALTIFGLGLSAFVGKKYEGHPLEGLSAIDFGVWSEWPVMGKLFFSYDLVVYLAFALLVGVYYFLFHTRGGLILRAVGENHDSAHSMGYSVVSIRLYALAFGGAMSGLAGAYLSLVYTPLWSEGMTAGKGWIVLALVVFASWRPWRLLLGTFLFGFVSIGQLFMQDDTTSFLSHIPIEFFSMSPYVVTIVVLVVISSKNKAHTLGAPGSLGVIFEPK